MKMHGKNSIKYLLFFWVKQRVFCGFHNTFFCVAVIQTCGNWTDVFKIFPAPSGSKENNGRINVYKEEVNEIKKYSRICAIIQLRQRKKF